MLTAAMILPPAAAGLGALCPRIIPLIPARPWPVRPWQVALASFLFTLPVVVAGGVAGYPPFAFASLGILAVMVAIDLFTCEMPLRLQVAAALLAAPLLIELPAPIIETKAAALALLLVVCGTAMLYSARRFGSTGLGPGDLIMLPTLAVVTPSPDTVIFMLSVVVIYSFWTLIFYIIRYKRIYTKKTEIVPPEIVLPMAVLPAGPGFFIGSQISVLIAAIVL